jgi:glucose 1-dehydrogenase
MRRSVRGTAGDPAPAGRPTADGISLISMSGPEILLHLDRRSPDTLARQLQAGLRDAIRSGRLTAGTRLPASRVLAEDLGVSRGVVVDAYAQLVAEGRARAALKEDVVKRLQGKVALVTGGSSGIGQAIAIRLGEEGASVAINYVGPPEGAISTKEAIERGLEICMNKVAEAGGRPVLVAADVSGEQAVEQMFDQVLREYRRLDILVNNAGVQIAENSVDLSAADFDKVLAVNLRGAFLCARGAVRTFLAAGQPGVIINVSSVHQVIPKPRFLGYSVSKGGMQNLTRSLALEYAARGIRVNAIGPGATVTPINRSWIDDPVKRRMVENHIPMRRAGSSEEMAAAVAFLCSDEAAYITGQTLFIDGGLTLYPSFETTWSSE